MAEIVLGIGTSHGPMLSTPWEEWGQRVKADQRAAPGTGHELYFQGKPFYFDGLTEERAGEHLDREITPEKMREHHTACQEAIAKLANTFERVSPDVAVIFGDDQEEVLLNDNMPAFLVYWGETIDNVPMSAETAAKMPPGIAVAAWGHQPPEKTVNPVDSKLGLHIIEHLMEAEFDVAHSKSLPAGRHGDHSVPHAYGFIYRRIMNDEVIPNVPIFLNTFYPPNQPTLKRCYKFGREVGRAVRAWESDKKVSMMASGGLTHFVIEEDLDHEFLDCLEKGDTERMLNLPVERFQAGSSEMRNWIALAGSLEDTGLKMKLVDYVPCYRSTAGTGNAMGFVEWT
jgi:hypothetical protein